MATKREVLAKTTDLSVEEVCCQHCERKIQKNGKLFCSMHHNYIKNESEDYCTYFLHTQRF